MAPRPRPTVALELAAGGRSSELAPIARVDFEFAARAVIAAKTSIHTRKAYEADLAGWIAYCRAHEIDPARPTLVHATRYRDALIGSDDTRRRRLASLSSIYRTLHRLGAHGDPVVSGNPFHPEILAWPAAGKVLKSRRISDEQGQAIVDAARAHLRDHALLCLLFDTGWRRSAVAAILRSNYRDGHVIGRQKGGKELDVELPAASRSAVDRWLEVERTSAYVFPADDSDGHVHPNTVNNVVARYAGAIAPDAHPHSFRALFIRDAHEIGLPAYEIQGAAGHASADMTARYDGKARGTGVARQVAGFRAQRRGGR